MNFKFIFEIQMSYVNKVHFLLSLLLKVHIPVDVYGTICERKR